jgi:hypothetical protein
MISLVVLKNVKAIIYADYLCRHCCIFLSKIVITKNLRNLDFPD